ncbi:tripartite tricarboxylate transporter substrate-binding protein [Bradyrhizobium uaiense]|uniref:Tripartite tricarboxylate transporter substrate binding protein n=1 Tax=Bradyrhizobium uaiense TaxID=2594946 RepID=A0A6P1BVZ5_9BRAD|nr:tripartite tricarboxylate transporter substrate-binding protein [Bradyrhizobium uaiense]NEV02707.1 hypothetical protein [Bradyrhizobium uaiense]
MTICSRLLAVFLLLVAPITASAQEFPTKPIRLIVPFPPGGPNDIIARVIGQKMSELVKQPIIVDNRAGQGGPGSLPHLACELFKLTAKIDIVHVPYRGAAPAVNDLLGQQVQMTFLDLPVILPQIKTGTLRGIALGGHERAPTAPDVPTTAEAGMPDLVIENWYGMVAPAHTPPSIIARLNKLATDAMADPAVKAKLAEQGLTLVGDTPEHFRDFIAADIKKWAKVIQDAGVVTAK